MPDYSKGKIYTIRCRNDDSLIYVGSTIQPLAVRWGGHKKNCNTEKCKNMSIYTTINGDWDNWYIELHSLYPCESKEELCKKEGEIIRLIGTLNSRIEGRTREERYQDNKEKILEYHKEYREKHKEEISEYGKKWYEDNKEKITCECGCIIIKKQLNRHKKTQKHIELVIKN
jgi:hypothetical protein